MQSLSHSVFTMASFVFVSTTALSQAQTIDVNEINQRAANHPTSQNPKSNPVTKFALHIGKGLLPPKNILPKDRKMVDSDIPKRELLGCVEKVIENNLGRNESLSIAQKMLLRASDVNGWSSDSTVLQKAADQCKIDSHELYGYPDRSVDFSIRKSNLVVNSAAEMKAKKIVLTLDKPSPVACQVKSVKAVVAVLFGFEAGVKQLKCLYTNGIVTNFFGPSAGFAFGVGASVSWRTIKNDSQALPEIDSPIELYGESEDEFAESGFTVTGIGSLHSTNINYQGSGNSNAESYQGLSLGLSLFEAEKGTATGALVFRMPNGHRHWGSLIDILN